MTTFISPEELRRLIAFGKAPHLLDVRWSHLAPRGQSDYVSGHLPGAVFVDLEAELIHPGGPRDGRHPLPIQDNLTRAARRWGIRKGAPVIVYDDAAGQAAARVWWLLKHGGVEDVRILDGALTGWRSIGGAMEIGTPVVDPGDIVLKFGHLPTASTEDVAAWPADGTLLDARARDHYLGKAGAVAGRAGHIPGAVSAPTAANIGLDGRFLSAPELRERFEAIGVTPAHRIAVYCTSGISAAHQIAALHDAGYSAALYSPSWTGWASNLDLPVETAETTLTATTALKQVQLAS